tara:strand:- start:712 stop:987 length:276 start_codon:yes stop_codon:yes gene_type:complete
VPQFVPGCTALLTVLGALDIPLPSSIIGDEPAPSYKHNMLRKIDNMFKKITKDDLETASVVTKDVLETCIITKDGLETALVVTKDVLETAL